MPRFRPKVLFCLPIPGLAVATFGGISGVGCSGKQAPNPFIDDAGAEDAAVDVPGDAPELFDAPVVDSGEEGGTLGRSCTDDAQCDDGVDCTVDSCDQTEHRCRNVPDDVSCQNGRYCDGVERCDPKLGCVPGEPVTCSDDDSCTIDRCVESTRGCEHEIRDVDQDGDGDWHCKGGTDCDDLDPMINGEAHEVCQNGKDDDCDGETDEKDCSSPSADTCFDAQLLLHGVDTTVSTVAASLDYEASCIDATTSGLRDIVVAAENPENHPVDMEVIAKAVSSPVQLAARSDCSDPISELACDPGWKGAGPNVSRLLVRNVGPSSTVPIFLFSPAEQTMTVRVDTHPVSQKPANETCGKWAPLVDGPVVTADLFGVAKDTVGACSTEVGELVYRFELTQPRDVHLRAKDLRGLGEAIVSLRSAQCDGKEAEIACQKGTSAHLFKRNLPAGTYYVTLSATVPSVMQLGLQLAEPTQPPAGDTCDSPIAIDPGIEQSVLLSDHTDSVDTCLQGAKDTVFSFHLAEESDVLLTERYSHGDTGAVSLWKEGCGDGQMIGCHATSTATTRLIVHHLPAGDYRAVAETGAGNPALFTLMVRDAVAPVLVPLSDDCATALTIPETGGTFQGNTSNMTALYSAGCDQGTSGSPLGAPEQMLTLNLKQQRRVVFDMQGSAYQTLLDVRRASGCPGQEVLHGCAVGYDQDRSYVDLVLPPGSYNVQVDGYYGARGLWFLDVFTAQP